MSSSVVATPGDSSTSCVQRSLLSHILASLFVVMCSLGDNNSDWAEMDI